MADASGKNLSHKKELGIKVNQNNLYLYIIATKITYDFTDKTDSGALYFMN